MKVQELRDLLKNADREWVDKAFVECYKRVTKDKKVDLDAEITPILKGEVPKPVRSANGPVDFQSIKPEIEEFLRNAFDGNYVAPNREVPKNQRSKWRFAVMNYIKIFLKVGVEDESYEDMVQLFMQLYRLLCTACDIYLFSTDDPFRSIGWNQPELFGALLKKMFEDGYSRERITAAVQLAVLDGVSRDCLNVEQCFALAAELKTSDGRQIAIEEIEKRVTELTRRKVSGRRGTSDDYFLAEEIGNLCDLHLIISVYMAEEEEGVRYYFDHNQEFSEEVTLYKALDIARWMESGGDGDGTLWLNIYRYALSRKIKPRQSLVDEYNKRMQKQQG